MLLSERHNLNMPTSVLGNLTGFCGLILLDSLERSEIELTQPIGFEDYITVN